VLRKRPLTVGSLAGATLDGAADVPRPAGKK
jgi:hypothetical protein